MTSDSRKPKEVLRELVSNGEDWLMARILSYAEARDYTQYTSTLMEAWRLSISGLSGSLLVALATYDDVPELSPGDDFEKDPCAAFGILEAQRHRARGIEIHMFVGLLKYYRQSYVDLVLSAGLSDEMENWCRLFVARFFDRLEIGLFTEWSKGAKDERFSELQFANRHLANEKNKYLTVFESLSPPVILIDKDGRVDNLNFAASRLFRGAVSPGSMYYNVPAEELSVSWLAEELVSFQQSDCPEIIFEKELDTSSGERTFEVKFARMLDVSSKYTGVTIILNDITARKQATAERERLIAELKSALAEIKTLTGLIPICASCKKVRDDTGYWGQIEAYIREHSDADFSHGLWPDCIDELCPEIAVDVQT
jgi:PAS domain-containing protein